MSYLYHGKEICWITGCRVPIDLVVNEYLSQIRVIVMLTTLSPTVGCIPVAKCSNSLQGPDPIELSRQPL